MATEPADEKLVEAWRLLMSLVLDQRLRWPEVSGELGISQAGLRALLAIDPSEPTVNPARCGIWRRVR